MAGRECHCLYSESFAGRKEEVSNAHQNFEFHEMEGSGGEGEVTSKVGKELPCAQQLLWGVPSFSLKLQYVDQ